MDNSTPCETFSKRFTVQPAPPRPAGARPCVEHFQFQSVLRFARRGIVTFALALARSQAPSALELLFAHPAMGWCKCLAAASGSGN
jgi:hypothetical protein